MGFKSGFVAVIGRPNVGKSTLINALVGEKVSITSPKAQTTRNRIFGIKNTKDYQIVFIDTPGVQHTQNRLGEYLTKATDGATAGVDAIVVVIDATKVNQEDYQIIERYKRVKCPVFLVMNKIELTNYEKFYPILAKLNKYKFIKQFITTSAIRHLNVAELEKSLVECLPEGEPFYPTDQFTDKSERFICGEIIREKALLFLQEEIPHGLAVEINEYLDDENLLKIDANLISENPRHKQIIIGKNGEMLKKIGSSARIEIEKLVGKKVMLNLFVKIKKGWKDDASTLNDLGFIKKDL